jgi:ankyrin repeat protein
MHVARTLEMIDALLAHGGNIHAALLQAARTNNLQIARLLLARGANPNEPVRPEDETPMHAARTLEMIDLLVDHGGDINLALQQAARTNNLQIAEKLLLTRNANPNALAGLVPGTAMHMARTLEMILLLVDHGGDINVALLQAIWRNDVPLVLELLARGADPNASVGPNGETTMDAVYPQGSVGPNGEKPMDLDRRQGDPRMIALLLNHNNRTLYRAVEESNVPAARVLIARNANPNAPVGPNSETARDLACRIGNPAVLAILNKYRNQSSCTSRPGGRNSERFSTSDW